MPQTTDLQSHITVASLLFQSLPGLASVLPPRFCNAAACSTHSRLCRKHHVCNRMSILNAIHVHMAAWRSGNVVGLDQRS